MFNELLSEHVEKNSKNKIKIDYKNGQFVFPQTKIKNLQLPVIGFGSTLDEPAERMLKNHALNQRSFIFRQLPGLSVEGTVRDAFVQVKDFKLNGLKKDELNAGFEKTKISFFLPKGSYATIVVKALTAQPK